MKELERQGWTTGCLGDLLPIKYGKSLPARHRDATGSVPVYGSSGPIGVHAAPLTRGPALIVGRKGTVGAVYLSPGPCWPIDTVYFAEGIRGQNLSYFKYLLDSLNLQRLDKSTAVPGLSRDDYSALEVTIAPAEVQERIVAEIEKQFSRLDQAVVNLRRAKANLKRYMQTCLQSAFELAQARGAGPTSTIDDVVDEIVDCPHSTPSWTPDGLICVRTTDFLPGRLDLSAPRYVSRETFNQRNARLTPHAGDVLYSREGGILGVACEIPAGVDLCLGQRMVLLRAGKQVAPRFMMHWLNSPQTLSRVRALIGGSASPHLNVRDIRSFPVPLPPLQEQLLIAAEIDRCLSILCELEVEINATMTRTNSLRRAVLDRSFSA